MRARGGGSLDRVKRQRVKSRRGARRSTAGRVLKVASAADLAGSEWGAGEGLARAGRNAAGRSRVIDGHSHSNSSRTRAMAPRTCKSRRRSGRRPCPPWCRTRVSQITKQQTAKPALWLLSLGADAPEMIAIYPHGATVYGLGFGLGVWVWARPFEKFPAENLELNPWFPRPSRQSDQKRKSEGRRSLKTRASCGHNRLARHTHRNKRHANFRQDS